MDSDGISGVPACSVLINTRWSGISMSFIKHFSACREVLILMHWILASSHLHGPFLEPIAVPCTIFQVDSSLEILDSQLLYAFCVFCMHAKFPTITTVLIYFKYLTILSNKYTEDIVLNRPRPSRFIHSSSAFTQWTSHNLSFNKA
jgi:hypothetical protein